VAALQRRIREFREAIETEITLLECVATRQNDLRKHLVERNWPELDRVIKDLERVSGEVAQIEERRVSLAHAIVAHDPAAQQPGIRAILRRAGSEERAALNDAYRRLKIAVLQVQSGARGIKSYATEAIDTTREVLHELFPTDTDGQYARDGVKQRGAQRALILDQTL